MSAGPVVLLAIFPIAVWLLLELTLPHASFVHVQLHSLVEALTGFSMILLGLLSLVHHGEDEGPLRLPYAGLVAMGIGDLFHGSVAAGNLFIWLRTLSSFSGSLGFSLVWIGPRILSPRRSDAVGGALFAVALVTAALSLIYPASVPEMQTAEGFSAVAKGAHAGTFLLFLAGGAYFIIFGHGDRGHRNLFLGSFAVLQAIAALVFLHSELWTATWWWWHLLRLSSGLILVVYLIFWHRELEDELRRAVSLREDLVAIASHELRGPLTALRLQAQLMETQLDQREKVREKLRLFLRETGRFAKVVDDLLDISRIHAGQLRLEKRPTDLGKLAAEILAVLGPGLQEERQEVRSFLAANVVGEWDGERLSQVLHNLLSNARKYGEGLPIEIRVWRDGYGAFLAVKDEGPGISSMDQRTIFEKFRRVTLNDRIPGLGVGLFITKRIVDLHGGRLEVRSTPGAGAEFRVSLPVSDGPER
jgi:signal transduction histidine kinase